MLYKRNKQVRLSVKPVIIGNQFNGPASVSDSRTGEFWVVLPNIQYGELDIQKCLLKNQGRKSASAALAQCYQKALNLTLKGI